VQVVPLIDDHEALLGASINFTDVTRSRRYKEELEHANQGLEDAYAELQATNEELQTINDELGQRTTELNQLNAFLESIWAGLDGAVTVLDDELRVLVWNHGSEELWGVRQEEVQGQHFLNLDIGLPIDRVRSALRAAMSGENGAQSTVIQATNRRGRTVTCRVTCTPLLDNDKTLRGVLVVVVDETSQRPATPRSLM
jgi:two-component system, chemotaxis family, CheB/CheR fusion protein